MFCNFISSSACSGNSILLNSCHSEDVFKIVTENGLHPSKYYNSEARICTEHFNEYLKINKNRSKRKTCQIPACLCSHLGVQYKASRLLTLCEITLLHDSTGVIIPVGTRKYKYYLCIQKY